MINIHDFTPKSIKDKNLFTALDIITGWCKALLYKF